VGINAQSWAGVQKLHRPKRIFGWGPRLCLCCLLLALATVGFARAQAGPLSLALIKREMEGLWVVPALCEPPIKCTSHSKWRQRVQLPPAQPLAVPGGYTASDRADTVLDALPPTERALAAQEHPWMMFPLSVPGGTLALLRHTPGVKKGWRMTTTLHSVVPPSRLPQVAPMVPSTPHPLALQLIKLMQVSWRTWEAETLRCVRRQAPTAKKGLLAVATLHGCFALVCPPAPARRLHHRSTQRPHPSSLPLQNIWYRMVPWTMVSLTLKRSQHRGLRLRGARFGECWATWARRWQWALTDATTPAPRAWLHRRQPVLSNGVYLRALFAAMAGMSSCSSRGSGWSSRTGQPCASGGPGG
jgi:hypothetical protein